MVVSKFATSQVCLLAQKSYILKAIRSTSVRNAIKIWRSRAASPSSFLKVGRLSGVCLSAWCIPFLRITECRSKVELSRRADHLSTGYLSTVEPALSLYDIWSLIRPYWVYFLAAVVSAILAAFVNIQLPIYLGELIDKMVQLIKDEYERRAITVWAEHASAAGTAMAHRSYGCLNDRPPLVR
ncbi:unnamed protein product [Strongylus vulgaris]|uniref:Uncharacterized protein n=1 Tax=Strongylus vulgaris TaxID=40348 RepID=A0A3P7K6H2_STRVU|nr:unnamed protein product [Strongylus vulgaris]